MILDSPMLEARGVSLMLNIVASGTILSGAEILARQKECNESGLFSWPVTRTSHPLVIATKLAPLVDSLCSYPQYAVAIAGQVLFAVVVLLHLLPSFTAYLLLAILLTHLLTMFRNRAGTDGADQMQTILLASLFCYYITTDPVIRESALWFITFQISVAYFTAGVAKLFSPAWRKGTVMKTSFAHLALGSESLYRLMPKGPRTQQLMACSVMAFESAFPLFVLAGPKVCVAALACGFLLHLVIAIGLGLPRFLFTFVAGYPAVFLVSIKAACILGLRNA
jgi:uncharacterized membrane protein YphA (DoxX/SURF4 family)